MVVGNNVAIWTDEEAGSLTPNELAVLLLTRRTVGTAELLEKLIEGLKRIPIVTICGLVRSSLGFHADRYNGRPDGGYELGEPRQGDLRRRRARRRACAKGRRAQVCIG
jgi:hypothetical protein